MVAARASFQSASPASAVTPSATIVMPILLTLYAVRPANTPTLDEIGGDIVTTRPNPPAFMCGRQARVMRNVPRTLIDVIRSYFLAGVSVMSCHHSADALLMRMSMRPNRSTTSATHLSIAFSSRRSTWQAIASAPAARTSSATV